MLLKSGDLAVKFHSYKIVPKSKFDTGTVKLDGADAPVKVTCANHAKFPAYTYLEVDGQLYYAKGDLRNLELTTPVAAPVAETPPVETPPVETPEVETPAPKPGKRK